MDSYKVKAYKLSMDVSQFRIGGLPDPTDIRRKCENRRTAFLL